MKRLLIGKRAAAYGAWLSRPGYDVSTAGEADMLFSTTDTLPILNFLARGTLTLAPAGSLVVPYGLTLDVIPIVFLAQRDASQPYVWDNHVQTESLRILPTPGLSSVSFENTGSITYEGRYVIFARPQL